MSIDSNGFELDLIASAPRILESIRDFPLLGSKRLKQDLAESGASLVVSIWQILFAKFDRPDSGRIGSNLLEACQLVCNGLKEAQRTLGLLWPSTQHSHHRCTYGDDDVGKLAAPRLLS